MTASSLRRTAVACAIGGALSLGAGWEQVCQAAEPAAADRDRARAEYSAASRHFAAEEYLEAAKALERAYAHDPRPDYLYQRGHALRLAGNCGAAVAVFTEVEPLVQAPAQREEVARWIEHCRRVLGEAGVEPPPPTPADSGPRPPPDPSLPGGARGPLPRLDLAAGLTLGLGSATAAVGASLLIASAVTASGGGAQETEPDYEARVDRARGLEIAGAVVLSAGAAAIVAAVVRYAVLHRRRAKSARAVARAGAIYF